ncbi:type B 50S ribosomal protein L31 [Candidatus Saccharibacteria bacterium]|nr:type B 50S ribosomal protein L31 [Candidatus Saccharibacteria bacterium]
MKKDIHAKNYRPVVFQDSNDGTTFLTRSTAEAEETITLDGVEYPLVKVHISSSSHPYFTGEERIVDIEGRVDKFKARQKAAEAAKATKAASSASRKSKVVSQKSKKPQAQKLGNGEAVKTEEAREQ